MPAEASEEAPQPAWRAPEVLSQRKNTHKSCYRLCSTSYGGTDGETLFETGKKAHHSYYNRKKLILIHEDNKNCKDADLF